NAVCRVNGASALEPRPDAISQGVQCFPHPFEVQTVDHYSLMQSNDLDQSMRQTLSGRAPTAVHARVQPRFANLAERLREHQRQTPVRSPSRQRPQGWWWTAVGVFGTAAVAIILAVFP